MNWQPIETAPKDGTGHLRGRWINSQGKRPTWTVDSGYVDDDGEFVSFNGNETGWQTDDYTHWMPLPAPPPLSFQDRVQPWLLECFGQEIADNIHERNHRFLEEALELVQSTGCTQTEAHQLVGYVFGRPEGEPHQEVGGVMVTLAALCLAAGVDMHQAGEDELARVWTKIDQIRAKQAAKPKHSPLPQHVNNSGAATD